MDVYIGDHSIEEDSGGINIPDTAEISMDDDDKHNTKGSAEDELVNIRVGQWVKEHVVWCWKK